MQEEILVRKGPEALLHSPTEGVTAFREALCRHMVPRGIRSSPEEVLVTSGSQQGLDLVARTLLSPGDVVVVEEPSYFGALEVFRSARVRLLGVPTDEDGMRTDVLEALLARQQPRLIYTLPTFQNPSGCVLSLPRRRHLLELAWRHQVPILEDDPYSDLRYEGEALPSLKALDPYGHVIHLSSFSKVLFPGLRLGLDRRAAAARPAARARQADGRPPLGNARPVDRRRVPLGGPLREAPRRRRGRPTVGAATSSSRPSRRRRPPGFTWNRPEGGFYVWCRLPEDVLPARLLAQAAAERVAVPSRRRLVRRGAAR